MLLGVSCTHQRPMSELHTLAGKRVTVEVSGSAESVDAIAEQTADGVVFHAESGQLLSPPTIAEVSEVHRGRGAAEGLGIGFAIGFPIGAAAGYISATQCDRDPKCWNTPVGPSGSLAGVSITW
jgi:hypothetical protein